MLNKISLFTFCIAFLSFALSTFLRQASLPSPNNTSYGDGILGEVRLFAGNFAPRGWAFCDGQSMPIRNNEALFYILGTQYGGDGRTNFKLPDLRGRTAIGVGNGPGLSPSRLGSKQGNEAIRLDQNYHNGGYNLMPYTTNNGVSLPSFNIQPKKVIPKFKPGQITVLTVGNANTSTISGNEITNQNTTIKPVDIMQPYIVSNYIICTQGTYPAGEGY